MKLWSGHIFSGGAPAVINRSGFDSLVVLLFSYFRCFIFVVCSLLSNYNIHGHIGIYPYYLGGNPGRPGNLAASTRYGYI